MKDSQKKKKKFKKKTPQKKKILHEGAEIALSGKKNNPFRSLFHFLRQRRVLLKISFLFSFFNLTLLIVAVYLFQNTNFQKRDEKNVLSAESYVYPKLEATHSALFVSTPAYIVYDPEARVIIAEKNSKLRFTPASSAKIMTALVALDSYKLEDVLIVPSLATVEGSSMGLFEDEKISVQNLLYGLMLPSGNDAAFTLASRFESGYSGFVEKMNKKAESLNMSNTRFVDPAGYDDANYTTAYDMARLGAYALQNESLRKVVSTKNIVVTDETSTITHNLTNLNELLGYNGVDGIKTGFTEEAGGVLVTSLIHDDRRYIIVLFKSQDRFYDTRTIMNSIIDSIRLITY